MIKGFFSSLQAYSNSIKYLAYPWVFKYLILSGIFSLLIFLLLGGIIFYLGDNGGHYLASLIYKNDVPELVDKVVSWISRLGLWFVLFLIMKYIVIIVSAPFMSALSEKLEERLYPGYKDPKPNELYSLMRGIRLSTSNLLRELIYTIPLLLLSMFLPFLAILIFLIQAYYAGFGNLDFFMERRFSSKESRQFVNANRGLAIGNGSIFLLIFLIPFVGAFVAPTLATISATISCGKLMEYDDF